MARLRQMCRSYRWDCRQWSRHQRLHQKPADEIADERATRWFGGSGSDHIGTDVPLGPILGLHTDLF